MPAPAPVPAPASGPGLGDILIMLLGLLLTLAGLGAGLLAVFSSPLSLLSARQAASGELAVTLYVAAEMALVLGVPLLVAGLAPLLQMRPRRFGLGRWWLWLVVWVGVLAAGQFVISLPEPPHSVEATLHLAGMLLPVLALVAWIAPRLAAHGITWRGAWLHLVSGATLSVVAAILLELVGVVLLAGTIYGLALILTNDAPARLQELIQAWNSGQIMQDTGALGRLLSWPALAIFAVLTFSVLVPLIEESAKPISVLLRLIARRREFDPGAAFLLGALCGAGFALVEGPLNTVTAIGNDVWVATVLLRVGATLLHAFNAALVAWGWAELIERRNWRRFLLGAGGALLLHGLWNGSTIVLVRAGLDNGNGEAVTVAGMVFFVLMSAVSAVGLVLGARRVTVQPAAAPVLPPAEPPAA